MKSKLLLSSLAFTVLLATGCKSSRALAQGTFLLQNTASNPAIWQRTGDVYGLKADNLPCR